GKTTTLKLLMGLIFPSGGSARILGKPIDDPSIKAQIGFLPEQPYFYDHLTATELLTYYAQLSGVPSGERRRRVEDALHRVGLPEAGRTQLRKLSKGMLQRVGIAQAILHNPKIVFLDEPMSGLDPIGRREVRDLIATLKEEGKTIFFSTHILSDAEALCDRVAVLNKGELRGIGAVEELTSRAQGRVEIIYQGSRVTTLPQSLIVESHTTGETVRVVVPQENLDPVLDSLRRAGARLISINPVRATLEDYFVEKIAEPVEAMQ
ncbi:MAG: ABC transporter ATP-binding protein, partial [Acidobacteria bacterium]|nr:ABC transporter ATP-binding protein [Acidobacteriota bacterium]